MPECNKTHAYKTKTGWVTQPHEYIAGICITEMTPATLAFLEFTFPFYRAADYGQSKKFNPNALSAKPTGG